jgi:arylsulfatase A
VDYFPTILEIVDAARSGAKSATARAPSGDGESITALLKGGAKLKRDTIYWHYPHYHPGGATPYSAIREGDWKLLHFFEDDRVELYNLKNDMSEKMDLAQSNAKKATELRAKLTAWRKDVGAQLPTKNPNHDPAREMENIRPPEKGGGKKQKG